MYCIDTKTHLNSTVISFRCVFNVCCAALCCSVLHCTVLCCTVLCVLCCTALCCAVLCCAVFKQKVAIFNCIFHKLRLEVSGEQVFVIFPCILI